MKELGIFYFLVTIIIFGCSGIKQERRGVSNNIDHLKVLDEIDTSMIMASLKPEGYPWNQPGYLMDIRRQKIDSTFLKYPNPFSPTTIIPISLPSDTISIFICNTDESSCLLLEKRFFEEGNYTFGVQKVNRSGIYYLKVVASDTLYKKRLIFNNLEE